MRTLLIDTASPVIGVAGFYDAELVLEKHTREIHGADAWLGQAIAEVLTTLGGLDRVAVSVGPGAFTGLRVGVASALGLALARNVGIVPISSLALRACRGAGEARVLVLLDARKDHLYGALFDVSNGLPLALSEEWDGAPDRVTTVEPAWVTGEGALCCSSLLVSAQHRLAEDPPASAIGAAGRWLAGLSACPVEEVALRYLRAPDVKLPTAQPSLGVGTS